MRGGMTTSTSQISSPGPSRALTHKSGSGNIIPRVFDAISSIQAGGLPGHSETIYCLKIIARSMQISMTKTCADCLTNSAFPTFDALLSSSSVNNRSCGDAGSVLVTSRDWLLSGSRDLSLRLWQLASPAPKVVKVFHGGHTGSVLSLDVVNIPMQQGDRSKYVPHGSPSRRAGLSYKEVTTRAMAVSGGSDGKLCLWDLEHGDGSPTKVVEAHEDSVYCVRADNERVVSCSKGGSS
jgi:WD40 repeat protein